MAFCESFSVRFLEACSSGQEAAINIQGGRGGRKYDRYDQQLESLTKGHREFKFRRVAFLAGHVKCAT